MTQLTDIEQPATWLRPIAFAGAALAGWGVMSVALPVLPLGWLAGAQAAWFLSRAAGIVAYLLLAAATIWGLLLSTKLLKAVVPPAAALAMHNYLSWSAIGVSIFHAIILLFDHYYTFTLMHLLIPFTGPVSPLWVGLGTIGLYLITLTSASFNWRKWLGQKRWRALHYLTFVAYLAVTIHGWMAGTDVVQLAVMYTGSVVVVLFLTIFRILTALGDR